LIPEKLSNSLDFSVSISVFNTWTKALTNWQFLTKHGLVCCHRLSSSAEVHNSQVFEELLDPEKSSGGVWMDSSHRSQEIIEWLKAMG
jgi:hypothetical protein